MDMVPDKERIEELAVGYDVANDFDYFNTKLASRIICPYCKGKSVLEIGAATGVMTEDLIAEADSVTIIEPSEHYCSLLRRKFGTKLSIVNDFIENTSGSLDADVIVMAGLLNFFTDPQHLLQTLKQRMRPDAIVLATVSNMTSLHRRIGVKSGMLQDVYSPTERNLRFVQPGRFDKKSFSRLFSEGGYTINEAFSYMLKPFSSEQMMSLSLDWQVIDALYELGKEYEDLASQLFICATPS